MAVKMNASGRIVNINPPTRLSGKQLSSVLSMPVDNNRIRAAEMAFKDVKISKAVFSTDKGKKTANYKKR